MFRWGNDDQVIGSATTAMASSEASLPPSPPSPTRLLRRPYDNVDPSSRDNPPDDNDEEEEEEDDNNLNNDSVLRFLAFLFSSDS
jgi:hypothetical protein